MKPMTDAECATAFKGWLMAVMFGVQGSSARVG